MTFTIIPTTAMQHLAVLENEILREQMRAGATDRFRGGAMTCGADTGTALPTVQDIQDAIKRVCLREALAPRRPFTGGRSST